MSKVHIHLTAASSSSTTAKKKHNNGKNTFSPTSLKINKILKASDFVTVEGLDLNTISKEMVMTTVADLIRKAVHIPN